MRDATLYGSLFSRVRSKSSSLLPKRRSRRADLAVTELESRKLLATVYWGVGPTLPVATGGATGGLLGLVVGGVTPSGVTNSVLTIGETSFGSLANLDIRRTGAGVGTDAGLYLVYGGISSGNQPQSSTTLYDPTGNSTDNGPDMTTPRGQLASAVDAGTPYAIGGVNGSSAVLSSVEYFNAATSAWSLVASMPAPRAAATAVDDNAGHIYVIGGTSTAGGKNGTTTLYMYTVSTNTWSTMASLPLPIQDAAAAFGPNGKLYVMGGISGGATVASVEMYDPSTNVWTTDTPLLSPVSDANVSIDSAADAIVLVGGFDASGKPTAATEVSSSFNQPPSAPTITGVSSTVAPYGLTYTATIQATTNPQAVYSIVSGPTGMTVNSLTGVITWSAPSTLETVPVTVQASNDLGTNQYTYNLVVKDVTPPSIPTGFVQTGAGNGSLSLAWSPSTDNIAVAGYQIWWIYTVGHSGRGGGYTTYYDELATTSNTSITLSGLKLNASYSLYLKAYDAAGNVSGYSSVLYATTAAAPDTVTLTSSATSGPYGESVTLSAAVVPTNSGGATPTGTFYFYAGSTYIGYSYLTSGAGQLVTTDIPAGTQNLTVSYSGDASYSPGVSAPVVETLSQDATTLTISAAPNPLLNGEEVVITGTVATSATGGYSPGGAVTYWENGALIGTYGLGATPTLLLPLGLVTITATYSGDNNYTGNMATPVVVDVIPDITTTTLTVAPNPATVGAAVSLSASVVSSQSLNYAYNGPPTGTVTFYDGSTAVAIAGLVNGVAATSVTTLPGGTDTLTAVYSGDVNNQPSTSAAVLETVTGVGSSTSLTLASSATVFGQSETLTATVTMGLSGGPIPTGTVNFLDGTTSIGSVTLTKGVAKLAIKTLFTGTHLLTADYSGDSTYDASASAAGSISVSQDGTTTTLTSKSNPSVAGQSVLFTTVVKPAAPGSGVPTGTVTFLNGSTPLATISLVNGVANLLSGQLPIGTDSITAIYSGDANFVTSTSNPVSQTVNQDATKTTVTSNSLTPLLGQTVVLKATVSPAAPGKGVPTGTVTFSDAGTPLATVLLVNGVASYSTSALPFGLDSITVSYGGDASFLAGASAPLAETVQVNTTAALSSSSPTAALGSNVIFTLAVGTAPVGIDVPTGTVSYYDGTNLIGTVNLVDGVATFSTSFSTAGKHSIKAVYSGDSLNRSKSATLTETIV